MKKKTLLLLSTATIFSILLIIAILPPAFASDISHKVAARVGNDNHPGGSNSHASVHNDNSVNIVQGGGGGGNGPDRGGNNHKNNNNNHKNNNDKKVVKKDVDKKVIVKNESPQPPVVVITQPPVPQIVNTNENNNDNSSNNSSTNETYTDHVVYVDRPVQEVASVQEHVVYPVQNVTTTPETGAEDIALLSLPSMAGAGLFLRRRFRI